MPASGIAHGTDAAAHQSTAEASTVRKKRKEKFTLFSDHNGSLLRPQPGATVRKIASCTGQPGIMLGFSLN